MGKDFRASRDDSLHLPSIQALGRCVDLQEASPVSQDKGLTEPSMVRTATTVAVNPRPRSKAGSNNRVKEVN